MIQAKQIEMIVNKLFWQKYRPKNLEALIILPRIKQQLYDENENLIINNHLLFTGGPGEGKGCLAEIIIPKGSLVINASYNSSVEDLKEEVNNYCRMVGNSVFDEDYDPQAEQKFKFVYLNEFDGVSRQYQEALRGFMEDNSSRVRFIATCNNVSKLSDPVRSRFTEICFDPANSKEKEWLSDQYLERAQLIAEKNKIEISEHELKSLVSINFPDLRAVMNSLQQLTMRKGPQNISDVVKSLNLDFFNLIFDKQAPEITYEWVMSNYGDKVEPLLKLCGRYLSEYIIQNKPEKIGKIPKIMTIVCNYSNQLPTTIDPLVLALACIYEIQEAINQK